MDNSEKAVILFRNLLVKIGFEEEFYAYRLTLDTILKNKKFIFKEQNLPDKLSDIFSEEYDTSFKNLINLVTSIVNKFSKESELLNYYPLLLEKTKENWHDSYRASDFQKLINEVNIEELDKSWKNSLSNLNLKNKNTVKKETSISATFANIKKAESVVSPDKKGKIIEGLQEKFGNDAANKVDVKVPDIKSETNKIDPLALWKYFPVPEKPEKHDEYATLYEETNKMKILGARVRGKKHKHEATNCDDWFEVKREGDWTIVAVSDGAGSCKYSRIGAKAACQGAIKYISEELREYTLKEREIWVAEDFNRNNDNGEFIGKFKKDDIDRIQNIIHNSIKKAYDAVVEAKEARDDSKSIYLEINRNLSIKDFSATLLVLIQTFVMHKGEEYSLALSCQIGDGMIVSIDSNYKLKLLGQAEGGDYSGETEFLTSEKKLEKEYLYRKTHIDFARNKALFVMTDGVADDYFPNDPMLLNLYGDLIINNIIKIKPNESKKDDLEESAFDIEERAVRITGNGLIEKKVKSFEKLKKQVNKENEELFRDINVMLRAINKKDELITDEEQNNPAERLMIWLDSYHKKGSFDDRTLVALLGADV